MKIKWLMASLSCLFLQALIAYAQSGWPTDPQGRQQALHQLNDAIQQDPNNCKWYDARSWLYELLGDNEAALKDIAKAIELNSSDPRLFCQKANIEAKLKDSDSALADCSTAIKLAPSNAIFYSNRGAIYCELGRFKEARSDLERSLKLDSTLAEAYDGMGEVLYKTGDYANAIKYCSSAIARKPLAEEYFYRSSAYEKLGNKTQARIDLAKAKELGYRPGFTFTERPATEPH